MDTETVKIACPANEWTQIADEHGSIYVQNQEQKSLRFYFGWSKPGVDESAYIVSQDYNPSEKLFAFGHAKTGIWVMPDGREPAAVVVVRTKGNDILTSPALVRTIDAPAYTLTNEDWGYILDFSQGSIITVPTDLNARFNCALRQGGESQITVQAGAGATVEETDGLFKSEKRLALLTVMRFPDATFQLLGRTSA